MPGWKESSNFTLAGSGTGSSVVTVGAATARLARRPGLALRSENFPVASFFEAGAHRADLAALLHDKGAPHLGRVQQLAYAAW